MKSSLTSKKSFTKLIWVLVFLMIRAVVKLSFSYQIQTIRENVVKPLNEKKWNYFSLVCNGSSTATTNDEKELYLIKTCKNGKPQFDVLSLQQLDDTSASGLHLSLKDSVRSANFSFERR